MVALLPWLASGLSTPLAWADTEQTQLTVEGELVKAPNAVARVVAKALSPALVGVLPVEQAQVVQWQSWVVDEADVFAQAVELNTFLEGRSFLVGTAATLADIQVYFALAPGVELSFPGPLGGLVHLMRWFDQVQHALRLGAFAAHTPALLPKLVPLHSIYKPLAMPVFGKKRGGNEESGKAAAPSGADAGGKKKGGEQAAPAGGKGKENKAAGTDKKGAAAAPAAAPAEAAEQLNPNALDIRVGKLVKVWPHPESEKLYCEDIDIGEESPRQIASGLRQFYSDASDLEGRLVLVLANLKPRKLVGFASAGMVLCASNAEHTEVKLVEPPATAKPGDRVVFPGFPTEGMPMQPNPLQKKKVFEALAPDLVTDAQGVCTYKKTAPFLLAGGDGKTPCTAPGMPNAHVS